jgi:hypothetical protein
MKTYEILTNEITNSTSVKATNLDGTIWVIPIDPANSDYAEYLRYTEWVEAGNDPDEFWVQNGLVE